MNQNFRWSEHVRSLQVAQAELSRSTRFSSWRWCWSKGLLNLVGWEHVTRGQASKTEVYRGFDQPKWDNNIMLYIIYIIMCIYIYRDVICLCRWCTEVCDLTGSTQFDLVRQYTWQGDLVIAKFASGQEHFYQPATRAEPRILGQQRVASLRQIQ